MSTQRFGSLLSITKPELHEHLILKKARNDKYNSSCKKTKIKKTKTKKTKQTNKKAHTEEMANFLRTYCFLGQINLVILILYARA